MMIYLAAALFACSASLAVVLVSQLIPNRSGAVSRRLAELEALGSPYASDRRAKRERWEAVLQQLGERVGSNQQDGGKLRKQLVMAGYGGPAAPAVYRGVRIALPLALAALAVVAAPLSGPKAVLAALWLGAMGWVGPSFYLDKKVKARQKELRLALPDALDLMVVCVEAGLGLNQAIVRISEEIRHLSPELSNELAMVNLEIRAGTPRDEALRNLGERTGVDDLRSLATLLVQTDRFGTSVAQALNIQSETLRQKRRQRAEEQAAKLSIKMLFPLTFFIFPALFVVVLGPAAVSFLKAANSM